ncbi:MAG: PQQ-binding-like beta-propeller repeat protein [Planctomycetes bacterium]|nr:PQQ-binding-like beta-propeller repeat protein [Planctomycetota bacterium]
MDAPYRSRRLECRLPRTPSKIAFAGFFIALLLSARPAFAIVPQLIGPFQALLSIFPQVLLALLGLLGALFSARYWRAGLRAQLQCWRGRPMTVAVLAAAVVLAAAWIALAAYSRNGPDTLAPITAGPTPASSASPLTLQPAPTAAAEDWPMFRFNLRRMGAQDGQPGPAQPGVLWTFHDSETRVADFSSSPAVAGGRVFFGGANANVFQRTGSITCLDALTGQEVWRTPTDQQVFSSPCVAGGRVYAGEGLHLDTRSRMRCLDARTGRILWEFEVASHAESSPTVSDGRVFFGAGEDGLYGLEAESGKPLWHRPGYHVDVSPAVDDGILYAGSAYDRPAFLAVDAHSGRVLWEKQLEASAWGDPAVSDGRVFFGVSSASLGQDQGPAIGKVFCLDARSGLELWSFRPEHGVGGSLVSDGNEVFFGCWDRRVYALDARTGRLRWQAEVGSVVYSSPALDAHRLYLGSADGRILALDRATGRRVWTLGLDAWLGDKAEVIASPALASGRLYVGASANLFLCLGEAESSAQP